MIGKCLSITLTKTFFTLGGVLNGKVDIKEISHGKLNTLGRGRNTGLMPPFTVLVRWQIITSIFKLMVDFGATCNIEINSP